MTTQELHQHCHKLLSWMVNKPGEFIHYEDAASNLGGSKSSWHKVFEYLVERGLAEAGDNYKALIELTPDGEDIARKSGGYLAYLEQQQQEVIAEGKRSRRSALETRIAAWTAPFSLIATIIIAIVQYRQNNSANEKAALLEVRQKTLADSLKTLYKGRARMGIIHPSVAPSQPMQNTQLIHSNGATHTAH